MQCVLRPHSNVQAALNTSEKDPSQSQGTRVCWWGEGERDTALEGPGSFSSSIPIPRDPSLDQPRAANGDTSQRDAGHNGSIPGAREGGTALVWDTVT